MILQPCRRTLDLNFTLLRSTARHCRALTEICQDAGLFCQAMPAAHRRRRTADAGSGGTFPVPRSTQTDMLSSRRAITPTLAKAGSPAAIVSTSESIFFDASLHMSGLYHRSIEIDKPTSDLIPPIVGYGSRPCALAHSRPSDGIAQDLSHSRKQRC